ncbi:MAG TPA: CvpA family protein [Verrucomicrobiae bacterium]|nr:CvpA family protein [Verrucomicrobiae bacterium]
MVEVTISIAALVLILSLAWGGTVFGVFYELTSSLLLFFAMMVTLRYWYEGTRFIESVMPGAGAYGAFGAYWAIFLLGCLPLILVLNQVTQQAIPRYPRFIDAALGVVFGFIASTILICCVMTSLSVLVPKIWDGYNHSALTLPFDQYPIQMYERIEESLLGIQKNDPGHTRFPTFEKEDADDFQKYWTTDPEKYWKRDAGG